MPRLKIELPANFSFSTRIPVRVTDLNYGNHVGNDAILGLIHEARMQFLAKWGYSEMGFAGASLIMSDAAIEFRQEIFYRDEIEVFVQAAEFTRVGFDFYYKIEKFQGDKRIIAAVAKTGMVCFNYESRKVVAVPGEALSNLR